MTTTCAFFRWTFDFVVVCVVQWTQSVDRPERADAMGQCINLDKCLAAETHKLVLVERRYGVVMGIVTIVVVVVVAVIVEEMMMVLGVVVSSVQGCDLVRIVCLNYLYMQLLEMDFFLEASREIVSFSFILAFRMRRRFNKPALLPATAKRW